MQEKINLYLSESIFDFKYTNAHSLASLQYNFANGAQQWSMKKYVK